MKLIEARKQARYTQQNVADYLGVSRPTYRKMEENPEIITIEDARKLSAFFGVDISQIFFESDYS